MAEVGPSSLFGFRLFSSPLALLIVVSSLRILQYITVMLANNKNAETITSELVDLIGDQYGSSLSFLSVPCALRA
jgi:hypothetical protein